MTPNRSQLACIYCSVFVNLLLLMTSLYYANLSILLIVAIIVVVILAFLKLLNDNDNTKSNANANTNFNTNTYYPFEQNDEFNFRDIESAKKNIKRNNTNNDNIETDYYCVNSLLY